MRPSNPNKRKTIFQKGSLEQIDEKDSDSDHFKSDDSMEFYEEDKNEGSGTK